MTPRTDEEIKLADEFYEFWQAESQHLDQKYLTPDTRSIIYDFLFKKFAQKERLIKEVEGMKKKIIKNRMGDYYEDENWEGYNSALEDILRRLQSV